MEEVPGVIIHAFPPSGFKVYETAEKQQDLRRRQLRRQQRQQWSQAQAARSESFLTPAATKGAPTEAGEGDGGDESSSDDGEGEVDSGESVEEKEARETREALAAAHSGKSGNVVFHPFLLVVPQLLSMGYQVGAACRTRGGGEGCSNRGGGGRVVQTINPGPQPVVVESLHAFFDQILDKQSPQLSCL
jgi:hypothetical protein